VSAVWTIAIEALSWMELEGTSLAAAVTRTSSQLGIHDHRQVAAARHLVRECLRRRNFIDAIIAHALAPEAPTAFSLGVQAFLRLYTYETTFTAAGRAAGVPLAALGRRILGWKTVRPVEEALGRILAVNPLALLNDRDEIERISLRTFHPPWFTRYCIRLLGRRDALQLLTTREDGAHSILCVNPFQAGEAAVLSTLAAQGVNVEPVAALPYVYRLMETPVPLTRLPAFRDGTIFLPTLAACLAVVAGKPTAGDRILDVGATHSGKAAYAALFLQESGRVIAVDYPSRRMMRLQAQLRRLGLPHVTVVAADPASTLPVAGTADVIYVSPPSSGSGAFWRTAAKWRGSAVVTPMRERQWRLLTASVKSLSPRGRIVYSTSSILVEENELIIERFIQEHPDFLLADVTPRLGRPGLRGQGEALRIYPHQHHVDGTFIACLVRGAEVDF